MINTKATHDGVMYAMRYHWGEAYVISFISKIYKYKIFLFTSNKNYYVDETDPAIAIDTHFNKRHLRDYHIVLVNIANLKLRRITKIMLKYTE